jgi:hypothetical protein
MENHKISNSYYLDRDVVDWVAAKGAEDDRSASYFLNQTLRELMDAEKKRCKP